MPGHGPIDGLAGAFVNHDSRCNETLSTTLSAGERHAQRPAPGA